MPKLFMKPNGAQVPQFRGTNPEQFPTMQALPILPSVPLVDALSYQNVNKTPIENSHWGQNPAPGYGYQGYMQDVPEPLPPNPMTKEDIEEYLRKPKRNVTHAFLNKAKACINCTHFLAYIRGSDGEYLNLCTYRGTSPWNANFTCAGSYCSLYCEKGKETSNLQAKSEPPKKRTRRTRAEIEAAKNKFERERYMAQPRPDPIEENIVMSEEEVSVINPVGTQYAKQLSESISEQKPTNNVDSRITFGGSKE